MNTHARTRTLVALFLSALLLAAPMSAMAKKGEKNYKRGMTHERAQQWEQAAQEFALAVAASPSDAEYQLHYRRAVFNASQVYMQKGRSLADKGDYVGAYNAFRQAYGYDPVNELAANEMRRVLRLQRVKEGLDPEEPSGNGTNSSGGMRVQPSSLSTGGAAARGQSVSAATPQIEERAQPLRQINYNGDLEDFIRKMAEELSLNVVFDQQFAQTKRNIKIQLRDVTAAQALDYIFLAYGLFFQKLSRRTIIVADQSKRPQYQQLVLKTFYLYNIKPTDARTLIQTALPANAGRQPQVVTNAETNSIIVRDTPENVRIIGELLKSVDKERAEVVMEVAIYEVSRTDLLQVGNQLGTVDGLSNLGGLQTGSVLFDGARRIAGAAAGATLPLATGVGLVIPASSLSLLQRKDNTRLVFSTAVHAFDDEKSEARVGARVPVQTASVYNGLTAPTGTGGTPGGSAANVFGNGYPVIQYEDTGLVLDFTPKVYPNQEVQVKMNIETKDTDGNSLTPTFTQRKITGTARIPNGRTMMLASIGQDRETNGRQGLPLLGLIPILGRLFTAPRKNNIQSDVVITLTPRILRAPEINPSDEESKPSGTMQTPTSDTLEALVRDADRDDALAAARRMPKNVTAQVNVPVEQPATSAPAQAAPVVQTAPTQTAPTQTASAAAAPNTPNTTAPQLPAVIRGDDVSFVPAPKLLAESAASAPGKGDGATALVKEAFAKEAEPPAANISVVNTSAPVQTPAPAAPVADAELILVPEQQELKVGERRRLMMMLKTDAPLGLVAATLRFDPRTVAVRTVSGAVLSADKTGAPLVTHTIDPKGVLVVSVAPASGATPLAGEGLLLIIEVEGLAAGEGTISIDADKVHFIATDGRSVRARAAVPARLKVVQ
ncbi:MAG TPA: secretin N-terminal domain-containing protein [Pyrinomonadaceae bacterium]